MNKIKKIGLLLVVSGVMTGLTQAAKEEKPDATIRLSSKAVAVGVGFSWGGGTLTYKGKDYPISVEGLSLGKVGVPDSRPTPLASGVRAHFVEVFADKIPDTHGAPHRARAVVPAE